MLPADSLSTSAVPSNYLFPDILPPADDLDYELGGIGLNDPSAGMLFQVWTGRLVIDPLTDVGSFFLSAPNTPEVLTLAGVGISDISFCFDQNMQPFVAFVQAGQAKYRWFDPTVNLQIITDLPAGTGTPRSCLDDKRFLQNSISDVILTYTRSGNLYYRQQRDRYGVEYLLATEVVGQVLQVGMNVGNRLQFALGELL